MATARIHARKKQYSSSAQRTLLATLLPGLAAISVPAISAATTVAPSRPNIVFFLVDDMGWQDCSLPFYSTNGVPVRTALNRTYRTPNLEALAARGLRFTNAAAHPVCSPSRVTLMTGMHPARHHVTQWTFPMDPQQTDSSHPSLHAPSHWRTAGMDASDLPFPQLLKKAGYRTIHVGKAHFGPKYTSPAHTTLNLSGNPLNLGFDVNIAGWGAGGPGSYLSANQYGRDERWHVPGLDAYYTPVDTGTHLTEALTLEMNKAIGQAVADGVPFYAYIAHYAIHAPYEEDRRFSAHYPGLAAGPMRGHATLIEGMDKSLGDLIQKLNELGVAENTLILFMGDNGAETPSTAALPRPSDPLRGRKGTPYEGGTRVPLLVAWAKTNPSNPLQAALPIPANACNTDIVAIEDIPSTILEASGLTNPKTTDGHSLIPYLKGLSGHHRPQEFITHFPHAHNDDFFSTLRQGDWKLIYRYVSQSYELYNLAKDIGEANNLAKNPSDDNKVRILRMARHLARELNRYGAQFPTQVSDGATRTIQIPAYTSFDCDGDNLPDSKEDANWNGLVDPGETDPDNTDTNGDGASDGIKIIKQGY